MPTFVPRGGLCFDIGAHVGNRSRSWSRLGASVVAIEPQPDFARFLRWLFRANDKVTVCERGRRGSVGQPDPAGEPTHADGHHRLARLHRVDHQGALVRLGALGCQRGGAGHDARRADRRARHARFRQDRRRGHGARGAGRPFAAFAGHFLRVCAGGAGERAGQHRPRPSGSANTGSTCPWAKASRWPSPWVDAAALRRWLLALRLTAVPATSTRPANRE